MAITKCDFSGVELPSPRIFHPLGLFWIRLIMVVGVLIGNYQYAYAHDPGLSRVELEILDKHLGFHGIFARRDIESLLTRSPGTLAISGLNGFSEKETERMFLAGQFVNIVWGAIEMEVFDIDIELDSSDAVHIRATYPLGKDETLSISSPMISELSLGHRQFVKLVKPDGSQANRILSARSVTARFEVPVANPWVQFGDYLCEGVWHIWIGYDHILFLIALLLPAAIIPMGKHKHLSKSARSSFYDVFKIVTAFTVAHSVTLALSVLELISLPSWLIESVIALSVMVAALNNVFYWWRDQLWSVAFLFGLIHGMGFASVLAELGLPSAAKLSSLFAFNIGVEAGQLAIVSVAFPLLLGLRYLQIYNRRFVYAGSCVIALVAAYWLSQRMDFMVLNAVI